MAIEQHPRPDAVPERDTLPLLKEVAHVDVHKVTTGRVRVSTKVQVVEELAQADLQGESVEVTRVAMNQPVTGPVPQVRTEGDTTIIPVFEEVLVLEKRLVLKEELRIRRIATIEAVEVPVELRHQTAIVERIDEVGQPAG